MRLKHFLILVLLAGLLGVAAPEAPSATRKATASKSSVKKGKPGKRTAKTRSTRKKRAGRTVRARRSGPPRQMAPTADRYREIQQALAEKGFFQGEANGQWGPESVDALKRFQDSQRLDPDGKLTARSLIALGLGPKRSEIGEVAVRPSSPQAPEAEVSQ